MFYCTPPFFLYSSLPVCVIGILVLIFSATLSIMQVVSSLLIVVSNITGLRLSTGPFGLPGLGRGIRLPSWISFGVSTVLAILFRMLEILSKMMSGPFLISSASSWWMSGLLLFFRRLAALLISLPVKGSFRSVGLILQSSLVRYFVTKISVKYLAKI